MIKNLGDWEFINKCLPIWLADLEDGPSETVLKCPEILITVAVGDANSQRKYIFI